MTSPTEPRTALKGGAPSLSSADRVLVAELTEANFHQEVALITRLAAKADDWQAMKDERDAAVSNYANLLADTNGEITRLSGEKARLEAAWLEVVRNQTEADAAHDKAEAELAALEQPTDEVLERMARAFVEAWQPRLGLMDEEVRDAREAMRAALRTIEGRREHSLNTTEAKL